MHQTTGETLLSIRVFDASASSLLEPAIDKVILVLHIAALLSLLYLLLVLVELIDKIKTFSDTLGRFSAFQAVKLV